MGETMAMWLRLLVKVERGKSKDQTVATEPRSSELLILAIYSTVQ